MTNENTTRLRLLPVCLCGRVFYEGVEVKKTILEHPSSRMLLSEIGIIPPYCPGCGREIKCIEYNKEVVKL